MAILSLVEERTPTILRTTRSESCQISKTSSAIGWGCRDIGIKPGSTNFRLAGVTQLVTMEGTMKTTVLNSYLSMRLLMASGLIAAFLITGDTTTISLPGSQPSCSGGGGPEDPINCVDVAVVTGNGSGCTSGTRCSSNTANKHARSTGPLPNAELFRIRMEHQESAIVLANLSAHLLLPYWLVIFASYEFV